MIKILLPLFLILTSTSFASTGAIQIYESLDTKETIMPAPKNTLAYKKSIGGLTCIKTNSIITLDRGDKISAYCILSLSSFDSSQIYYSLDVVEVPMAAPRTQMKSRKSVGGLNCIKTNNIIGRDSMGRNRFDCTLVF